jgi:hypothetical protein
MICSPQYSGNCSSIFVEGIADLAYHAGRRGLSVQRSFLLNSSLIADARNSLVDKFLRSSCEHLMFIDSDIGFTGGDVLELLFLQTENADYDILAAPYRVKSINGHFVFNAYDASQRTAIMESKEPVRVGTGFMMIRRTVFERFAAAYPEFWYRHPADGNMGEVHLQCFHTEIDPVTRRYLSEDYWFCQRCGDIGLGVWLCPWFKLQHAGTHIFE